jgi:lipoprotein-anchoring transpeptidase ErfK/SrfK
MDTKVVHVGSVAPLTAIVALTAAAGLAMSGCGGPARKPPAKTAAVSAVPAGASLVATLTGAVTRYASPDGASKGQLPDDWLGVRSTLPVLASRPGWLRVGLPRRPNGSTAWVPAKDVRLSMTPYRVVINLATTHLTLDKYGKQVFTAPAGVGTRSDPTPTGHYFVAFFEKPPPSTPGYGAFIMVTSAHSDAIKDWDGSGDAVIGIHGPLGEGKEIGTKGARISHGCIRLHEADLLRLRDVPVGTPIDIMK